MTDRTSKTMTTRERLASRVVQNVCELPDYTSPDDQPDLVMCKVQELEACVLRAFEEIEECSGVETDGYSQEYADQMRQALLTIATSSLTPDRVRQFAHKGLLRNFPMQPEEPAGALPPAALVISAADDPSHL